MIKFKTLREETEYGELFTENSRLCELLHNIESFVHLEFKKEIVITSIHRTEAEHQALYVSTPEAQRPKSSVHCQWEGLDLRSSIYTESEINRIVNFVNQFTFRNGKKACLYHEIPGNARHLHIQYSKV